MTVGKAIFYLLNNSTELTAIVGTRIYPEVAQQDAPLPYVVYNISNNEPSDTKREPSKMDTANIEVNLYSTSYTEVIDMSTAVRAALDRVTGTYSGVNVQSISYMNEVIDFDEAQRAYNVSSDYDVRISRNDFEIAQGSPITGVDLGDLADVNTTGVTDGQVIAYDAATSVWLPATDAGGAEQLNDLSDVIISQPESGDFFRYDGDEWVNDTAQKSDVGLGNVDNTSDANKPVSTATQTALDLKADITSVPTDLDDLNDVQIIGTPTLGQALVYGAGKWLPGAAGATTLGALDDVNTTGAGFGSLLTYNGASWDISGGGLPTDDIYFHQRYETESEALRTGATATVELYFTCTAQGNGLAESASSDTPTAGYVINRKIYYSEEGFADPDTATWVQFSTLADDITFANAKAAILENLKLRTGGTVPISLKQTWEETAEAPSFTGLLNETYGSGAEAAYSTRRLNGNVTDCMVIRRASDSTTTTIGFDTEGNIDEAAITTFCTGTTCTVEEWLDQSGNGNHATQSTPASQPTIYTGGALVKDGGRVALTSTGSTSFNFTRISDIGSLFSVLRPTDFTTTRNSFILGDTVNSDYHSDFSGGWLGTNSAAVVRGGANYLNGTSVTLTNVDRSAGQYLLSMIHTSNTARANAISQDRNALYGQRSWIGNRQEIILYASDKSANRASIESNVGDYFTQNTPLLDTYTGAAAAYSLRLLRTAYTGDAVEVYNGSSYADIGFNCFGELDTVALAAHCGASDGFVSKWYDQSSNSNTAAQTTTSNMPKIYDGTTGVVTENGKPSIRFATGSQSTFTTSVNVSTPYTFSAVWIPYQGFALALPTGQLTLSGSRECMVLGQSTTTGDNVEDKQVGVIAVGDGASSSASSFYDTAQPSEVTFTHTSALDVSFLGNRNASTSGRCSLQEFVVWGENQDSSNRTDIEDNINLFYNIYS